MGFDAGPLFLSPVLRAKLVLVGLALINGLVFRKLFGDLEDQTPPPLARTMAATSLALWLAVAGLGRWIAYV